MNGERTAIAYRVVGHTHNVNALVTGNTNFGGLGTQIYANDRHVWRK